MIEFVTAHQGELVAVGIVVLDFLFGVNPKLETNGVLHGLYLFLKGLFKAKPQA